MNSLLILAPLLGVGIGAAAAFGVSGRNKRIHFVERGNLDSELDDLEIEVENTEVCVECGDEVDPESVGAIVREGDEYRAICNKETCLDTYDIE